MNLRFTTTSLPYPTDFYHRNTWSCFFRGVSNGTLLTDLEQFRKEKLKSRKWRKNTSFIFDTSTDSKCWLIIRNFLSSSWVTIHFIVNNRKNNKKKDVTSCKVSGTLTVILENGMAIFFRSNFLHDKKDN